MVVWVARAIALRYTRARVFSLTLNTTRNMQRHAGYRFAIHPRPRLFADAQYDADRGLRVKLRREMAPQGLRRQCVCLAK